MIKGMDITCTFGLKKPDMASSEEGNVTAVAGKEVQRKLLSPLAEKSRDTAVDRWSQGGGGVKLLRL